MATPLNPAALTLLVKVGLNVNSLVASPQSIAPLPLHIDDSDEIARLRAENAQLKALAHGASDIAILLDRNGRLKMASPAAVRLLGADFIENSCLSGWVHLEDQNDFYRNFADARVPGEVANDAATFFRVRAETGDWRTLEATFTDRRAQSAVNGIVLNARVLEASADLGGANSLEAELDAIINAAPLFVFRWDRAGTYVGARGNYNAVLKMDPRSLVGSNLYQLFAHKPEITGNFERALAGEEFRTTVHFGPHPFESRHIPAYDEKGCIVGVIGVTFDVSRIHAAERAIEQARAQSEIEQAQTEVLERLSRAGEFRDDDTGQHTRRVGDMAARLAALCGFSPERAETMRRAAPLHDIGKIGVPDSILLKPGKLTSEEFAVIKTHCEIGARLLADGKSELVQMAQKIARSHHERFDGTGYPDNLAGDQIPLEGRIVAVVDVYDALTSERPYKAVWPVDKACAEIQRCAGTQFDPIVVEAFIALMAENAAS